jgi:acetyl-CoA carboxylase biotin carboxyl carrier protein
MTIDEIKELVRVVHETGIAELEVQRGDDRVCIRSNVAPTAAETTILQQVPAPAATPLLASASAPQAETAAETGITVKSPIVGTYYDAPSPGAALFVKVGDQVEPGKVLCIIESMKLMNEIEAEVAGTLVSKMVENGKPVEYGEPLFTIRPH